MSSALNGARADRSRPRRPLSRAGRRGERAGGLGLGLEVVVVGGGLAGLSAALDCVDAGASVTLVEQRRRLGGLTWSFEHAGRQIDGGQHVFLRCCTEYRRFLRRIGSERDVYLQPRLDVSVLRPGLPAGSRGAGALDVAPIPGHLRRSGLPAPLHLGRSLLAYPHLHAGDKARLGLAAAALRRVDLGDPCLDGETFASWLGRHGQSRTAVEALWDLITLPTVNLPASQASAAMGAKVFKTGLLRHAGAADIGWALVPLGVLHGTRAASALACAGATVRTGERVTGMQEVGKGPLRRWSVSLGGESLRADAVVVAVAHLQAASILPPATVAHQEHLSELGASPIVDVHLLYDRQVTDLPIAAGIGTEAQWIFDRTASSGLVPAKDRPQYLAVSISGAAAQMRRRPAELAAAVAGEMEALLPAARHASLLDTLVTKEKAATFAAVPGSAALRPPPRTKRRGIFVAGAWTDTGWPATMEGAVRSGRAAAAALLREAAGPAGHGPSLEADRLLEEEMA